MVEFGRVKGKVRFRVSTEKLYGRVPENGRNREYKKMVESGRGPVKGTNCASTETLSG